MFRFRNNHILLLVMLGCFSWRATGADYKWEDGPNFRRVKLHPNGAGKDGFTQLSPQETQIHFANTLSEERTLSSQILPSGSGVAAGDVDGDGLCDLYFGALKTGSRLYRNLGNWKFEDITGRTGVGCPNLDVTGAALVDFDGDGDLDLIVNSLGGGTHFFVNDGKGNFTGSKEVLNVGLGGMPLALADYDGDGWLDLYVANYRLNSIADRDVRYSLRTVGGELVVAAINGKPLTDPEWTNRFQFQIKHEGGNVRFAKEELGEPDVLYRNVGKGEFKQVPWTGGVFLDETGEPLKHPPFDWGLSVMFHDLNGDGKPDIYVCNDFNSPDRIWINAGQGRFRAMDWTAIRQIPFSSMGVDVADVDGDGFEDIFVCEMLSREHQRRLVQRPNSMPEVPSPGRIQDRPQHARNMLYLNRRDGTYAEVAQYAGLEASEWSWTPMFLDVDLDGYPDLLVANGFARDNMNVDALEAMHRASRGQPESAQVTIQQRRLFPKLATPNCAFRNLGGVRFTEVGRVWGFDSAVISQGMCLADLDNDGDLDAVANNFNSPASIYRNDAAKPRVAVMLKGLPPNTRGIGAKIRVYGGPVPAQSQQMICGGRYLSSDQPLRVFAAGALTNLLRIEVDWPRGSRSVVNGAVANFVYEINEAGAVPFTRQSAATNSPFFQDVSRLLSHEHHDDASDDFARQPTLPRRLSQLGPGLCWSDVDGDGWDDLAIGGGKGGALAVLMNDRQGGFTQSRVSTPAKPLTRDQTGVLAWPRTPERVVVLGGSANYEDGSADGASVLVHDPIAGTASGLIPARQESVGPLALGDLAGNDELALFVGGRMIAGKYPQAASSRIFRSRAGKLELDEASSKVLEQVGLVSGAVWSDLDGDGLPELLLACEWGPLKIFRNVNGKLHPWNPPVTTTTNSSSSTLNQLTGWWNGITTGDFDGDGRLDIIASNWGQNSKYERHRASPLRVYFGDFSGQGMHAVLESYFELGMGKYVPGRRLEVLAEAMPFLRGQFGTHQAFANAGVDEVLRDYKTTVQYLEANCLETILLLNRGDRLEKRVLPAEAQFAPAFGIVVADYDGDGREDVFLSQNFFAEEPETSRCDAGRGLWLRGDGRGGLNAVPGPESGVMVYGEQRAAAAADFDRDGRVDLVVTQNAAETRLFRNLRGKPGLRVRLQGPPGNPLGYGVQLRLKRGEQLGPVREVRGGGGYWSQDSPVQVIGGVEPPTQIWVRWPGGKTFTVDVPADAMEVQISMDGRISRLK